MSSVIAHIIVSLYIYEKFEYLLSQYVLGMLTGCMPHEVLYFKSLPVSSS